MKKCLLLLSCVFAFVCSYGQEGSVMLYPNYENGVVYMKGNQIVRTPLNYDASKRQVMYQQDGENMILTNMQMVDSIKIGKDLFLPIRDRFYEVLDYQCGKLLVDWNLRNVNVGYKGAYGNVSQVRSQSVKLSMMEGMTSYATNDPNSRQEVYKVKNENQYIIVKNGHLYRFSNKKTLLKHFEKGKEDAEAIISKRHTDFSKAEDVINIVGELLPML